MNRLLLPLLLVLALVSACGSAESPTTWQDVAFVGTLLLGLAAINYAAGRRG